MLGVGSVIAIVLGVVLLLGGALVLLRGRPFTTGPVFRASRLTRGNHLFPTQVAVTASTVIHHTARWLGADQETIHINQVASVTIRTGLLFSDVVIETTGGSKPIVCHGHTRADAVKIKDLIARHQASATPAGPGGDTRPCPFCAETIKAQARLCRFCGRDLEPARA